MRPWIPFLALGTTVLTSAALAVPSGPSGKPPTPASASAPKAPVAAAPSAKPSASAAKPNPAKPIVVAKAPPPKAAPKKVAAVSKYQPPGYLAMVKAWHLATANKPPVDSAGHAKLVLAAINRPERIELAAKGETGGFVPTEIDKASFIMRSGDGHQHPIDPRLLDLVYRLQQHFGAGEIRFLSGYRTPKKPGSNHGYGRAMDLVVPGATDEEVVTYARTLGFVGVGIYPTSGFVHLDVRDRSFFWVDKSGPGAPNKTVGILGGDALANDAKARKEGRTGSAPAAIGRDVAAALAARAKAVSSSAPSTPEPTGVDEYDDDEHDE